MSMVCTGCGAPLQMDTEGEKGYVTSEAFMRENPLCQRCFRLIHYGQITSVSVTEEEYRSSVMRVLAKPSLVLYVVDLFDFHGSLVRGLTGLLKAHDVILVANKFDLFPAGTSVERVESWLAKEGKRAELPMREAVVVSAKSTTGLERLWQIVRERAGKRQVVVVGMANVGKSSLLNRLFADISGDAERTFTTSPHPGTTLGALSIKLPGSGLTITDTPGLLGRHRLQDRVCQKSVKLIMPKDRLRPKIYQLQSGQTLFVGGLARIDFEEGQAQPFVLYVANQLQIHRTKLENADGLYARHLGGMLNPPCTDCDDNLKKLVPKKFSFEEGRPVDIAISGLGWLRLSGKAVRLRIHVPKDIELVVRPALFSGK